MSLLGPRCGPFATQGRSYKYSATPVGAGLPAMGRSAAPAFNAPLIQ
ncbi:hypothetical protein PSN_0965 [Pseudomonas sp. NGC7]